MAGSITRPTKSFGTATIVGAHHAPPVPVDTALREVVVSDPEPLAADPETGMTHVPSKLRPVAARMSGSWLGRILVRGAARFRALELFDRSMTVAAEVFTAVFPLLILAAEWLGSQRSNDIAASIDMPSETRQVVQDAVSGSGISTFGLVGALWVLISATSLSRALTRAFAAIWEVSPPRKGPRQAGRWLAAVIVLTAAMVLLRWLSRLAEDVPPGMVWGVLVSLVLTTGIGTLVPWLLLSGKVPARCLMPGALVFGLGISVARPIAHDLLTNSLDSSAEKYGTIGVAFTYIAFLYALSLWFLAAAFLGQVISTDEGRLGCWIRREDASRGPVTTSPALD
jgi:membrane protein